VFDDFTTNISVQATTAGGTNAIGSGGQSSPGIDQMSVAAVGDAASTHIAPVGALSVIVAGGGAVAWLAAISLNQLSDGVNNGIVRIGQHDASGAADAVDGIYYEYDFGTNGDHRWRLCCSSNSVRTKTDTGIVAVAGVAFVKFAIAINAGGTSATGTIGGVAVATPVTTNIPTTVARIYRPSSLQLSKQLGVGAFIMIADYHGASQAFTTVRS
jgi:hypothetical protein